MGQVVVGVDGSVGAQSAIRFAIEDARRRGASLHVVYVAQPPTGGPSGSTGLPSEFVSESVFRSMSDKDQEQQRQLFDQIRRQGDQLLTRVLADEDVEGLKVSRTVLLDRRPARRLVELVNTEGDVDLLVVGSRGRGELTGVLLGSVSQACVAHARVPVTVVPLRR